MHSIYIMTIRKLNPELNLNSLLIVSIFHSIFHPFFHLIELNWIELNWIEFIADRMRFKKICQRNKFRTQTYATLHETPDGYGWYEYN